MASVIVEILGFAVAICSIELLGIYGGAHWAFRRGFVVQVWRWHTALEKNQLALAMSRIREMGGVRIVASHGSILIREKLFHSPLLRGELVMGGDENIRWLTYSLRCSVSIPLVALLTIAVVAQKFGLIACAACVVAIGLVVTPRREYLAYWRSGGPVRPYLRELGVRACSVCGYDLFGLGGDDRLACPECGTPTGA